MKGCNIFEIWEEYKSSLLHYIMKHIDRKEEAEDILHDVLLKSYKFCAEGKSVLYMKSWLYKITQNTLSDYHKNKIKNISLEFDIIDETDEISLNDEVSDFIKILFKLLPENYSIPLYMYEIEGIDQATIASKLNLTLANTKSKILRGRQKLKSKFLSCCKVEIGENGEITSFDVKPECSSIN
jgi:RNA polymerase sigma-70 factor (ECF subfamily)